MTIAEQLKFAAAQLADWVKEIKGRVDIASDPVHVLSLLATSPGAPRVVLMFDSEDKRGEYEETGRVDRKFWLVISRGRGFRLNAGDNVLEGSAGGQPLYDLIEQGREVIRAMKFDEHEARPDYKGVKRLTLEDVTIDAYQIEFTIGTQLPYQP